MQNFTSGDIGCVDRKIEAVKANVNPYLVKGELLGCLASIGLGVPDLWRQSNQSGKMEPTWVGECAFD